MLQLRAVDAEHRGRRVEGGRGRAVDRRVVRVGELAVEVEARIDRNELEVKVIFDIIGLEVPTQSFTFLLEPTR